MDNQFKIFAMVLTTEEYIKQYNGLRVLLKYGQLLPISFPKVLLNEILDFCSFCALEWIFTSKCDSPIPSEIIHLESENKIDSIQFKFTNNNQVGHWSSRSHMKVGIKINISFLIEIFPDWFTKNPKLVTVLTSKDEGSKYTIESLEKYNDYNNDCVKEFLTSITLNFHEYLDELNILWEV